jgi:hypothetical protein
LYGPRGRLASIEHLGSVHDERELESLKAAAGRVFTQPLALARRPLLEAAGLTFSVAVLSYGVEAKVPRRSEGMGIDARATRGRRSQDQAAG